MNIRKLKNNKLTPPSKTATTLNLLMVALISYFVSQYDYNEYLEIKYGDNGEVFLAEGPFKIFEYRAEYSIEKYNSLINQDIKDRDCGPNFALLVDDPHSNNILEKDLFGLFGSLQSLNPKLFDEIFIFQEGTNSFGQNNIATAKKPSEYDGEYSPIVKYSYANWTSRHYNPLNGVGERFATDYFDEWILVNEVERATLFNHSKFNATVNGDYSINTGRAVYERINGLGSKTAEDFLEYITDEKLHSSESVNFLIDKMKLRASYAYEIHKEGLNYYDIGFKKNTVSIFGVEDFGLYRASCHLAEGCINAIPIRSYISDNSWISIQPYRDWTITSNILSKMGNNSDKRIPVVLASAPTHLPVVRELLCEEGYDSATLITDRSNNVTRSGTVAPMGFLEKDWGWDGH